MSVKAVRKTLVKLTQGLVFTIKMIFHKFWRKNCLTISKWVSSGENAFLFLSKFLEMKISLFRSFCCDGLSLLWNDFGHKSYYLNSRITHLYISRAQQTWTRKKERKTTRVAKFKEIKKPYFAISCFKKAKSSKNEKRPNKS